MNKKFVVIVATSLVGLGLTGFYGLKGTAAETGTNDSKQQQSLVEEIDRNISLTTVQSKMLNAIDHYQSATGSFRTILTPIGVDETVDFEVYRGTSPWSHVKVTNNQNKEITETTFDGNTSMLINHNNKTYMQDKVSVQKQKVELDQNKPRSYKNDQGELVFVKRQDAAFSGIANDVLFPQDYAFWLTPSNYKIAGEEELLNRTSIVIEGEHDDPILAKKHQSSHFKMWIDKETGVLLKLVETNNNNEVTNSIEVLSIEFDKQQDFSTLSKTHAVPSDYKDVSRKLGNRENREEKKSEKEN
ncbi:hypothetical protein NDK47_06775 [Brevibacillus ruminantium]|uniref:MucB/RseB N-terminal domain-containing protein n=1 Tax=Brevibacillus ruminantium TaxID=2950604 RepID=A0ABY4WIW8_9BACL|nr:hypothetical protein [Brevibacillus ruminantium]USG66993.1 hypothetical protein NDK47_06775 [Brevibacillus ruminantium]